MTLDRSWLYIDKDLSDLEGQDIISGSEIDERRDNIESEILDEDGNIKPDTDPALVSERNDLLDIIETIEGYSEDRLRDVTLYRDSYFPDYAEQFADDIGVINTRGDTPWPLMHIDWNAAADDLKQDYTSVDIGETEYWFR